MALSNSYYKIIDILRLFLTQNKRWLYLRQNFTVSYVFMIITIIPVTRRYGISDADFDKEFGTLP